MAASAATQVAQASSGIQGQKLRQRRVRAGVARRATTTTAMATVDNKAEWNSLGKVCAVLGSQWGDEGKGKLVDILAQVRECKSGDTERERESASIPHPITVFDFDSRK